MKKYLVRKRKDGSSSSSGIPFYNKKCKCKAFLNKPENRNIYVPPLGVKFNPDYKFEGF